MRLPPALVCVLRCGCHPRKFGATRPSGAAQPARASPSCCAQPRAMGMLAQPQTTRATRGWQPQRNTHTSMPVARAEHNKMARRNASLPNLQAGSG